MVGVFLWEPCNWWMFARGWFWRALVSSLVWVGLSLRGFGVSQDGEETLLVGDDGTLS